MDELYENAWDEPAKPGQVLPTTISSWTSPTLSLGTHDEVDVSAPVWSTSYESSSSQSASWSHTESDPTWTSDIYAPIPIDPISTAEDVPSLQDSPREEEQVAQVHITPAHEDQSVEFSSEKQGSPMTLSPSPELPNIPRSASPDGFGAFETGFATEGTIGSPLAPDALEADAWSSAWVSAKEEDPNDTGTTDEWEVAKKRKEQLDRKVPPELLASIIAQCEELSHIIWPEPASSQPDSTDREGSDREWSNDWRSGMAGIEGLDSLTNSLLPPLTLQPPISFRKTAIAHNMATAVRLTKNLPLVHGSPLWHYMNARGTTSFKTVAKVRDEIAEDTAPVGWRILEKSDPAKKTNSRLFSFWGRKDSSTSQVPVSPAAVNETPFSPAASPKTTSATETSQSTARPSAESARSFPITTSSDHVPSVSSTNSPRPQSMPSHKMPSHTRTSSTPQATPSTSYAEAPEPPVEHSQPTTPTAPSAVSRFLNRFSRRGASHSSTSPHSSLALSSDDLEFLSDIVPSASDNPEQDSAALAEFIKPQPLPPALPPPPILPPPPPIQVPKPPSNNYATLIPSILTPSSRSVSPSRSPNSQTQLGSFDSFFDPIGAAVDLNTKTDLPVVISGMQTRLISSAAAPLRSQTPGASSSAGTSNRNTRSSSPPSFFLPMTNKAPTLQPFKLSPPPSSNSQAPSRARSPLISVPHISETTAAPSDSSIISLGQRQPSSSTLSPPSHGLTVPVSPNLSERSNSPTSLVPLAELYPSFKLNPALPHPSLVAKTSTPTFPPPTPAWTPDTSRITSTQLPPLLPPPPARAFTPTLKPTIALKILDAPPDDDDDFSEFHSSPVVSRPPSTQVGARVSLLRSNTLGKPFPPPPSSGWNTFASSSSQSPVLSPTPLLSPPQSSLVSTMALATPSSGLFGDDDGFASFSSPMSASKSDDGTPSSSPMGFGPSSSSGGLFLTSQKSSSGFDDSSSSPTLRTPSPPRLPSKTSLQHLAIKRPNAGSGPSATQHARKPSLQVQHQHTLSLMERAAARPGQWPAPASPLPQALTFTIPGVGNSKPIDLMGDDMPEQVDADILPASMSESTLLASVPGIGGMLSTQSQSLQGLSLSGYRKSTPGNLNVPATLAASSGKGGLSAQDLSFFEGL